MKQIPQNCVLELSFISSKTNFDGAMELDLIVTDPSGHCTKVPGFWAGKNEWRVRYASTIMGDHQYVTECSDPTDTGLMGQSGTFQVIPYQGSNPLYQHGKVRVSPDHVHLEHTDGTPFFWLGDTWWMGLTKRLHWPEEFALLTQDRVKKGFTLIQIVAGLYPDMPPFDERGVNEAGYPWQEQKYEQINPQYFDLADRRIQALVEAGLVPCIVGFWGFFLGFMSIIAMKKHWRYIIARWGAYPVVWCMAGEAMMQWYLTPLPKKIWNKVESPKRLAAWSEIAQYMRTIDGFHNPVTVHPTQYGHEQLDNPHLLDINMLQTGHANPLSEIQVIENTGKMITKARKQKMPVVVGEVCYEGIFEANHQEIQRCLFWGTFLRGGSGHTYGANGIWQLNRRDKPYGESPYGGSWGYTAWEDAYQLLGSAHVGIGKEILSQYPWAKLEPHPEWVYGNLVFAAGIPRELRIIYIFTPGSVHMRKLEKGIQYNATWIDPKTKATYPIGAVQPDKSGHWRSPRPRIFQDWLLVLENKNP